MAPKAGIEPAAAVPLNGIDVEHLRIRLTAEQTKADTHYRQRRLELFLSPVFLFFLVVSAVVVGAAIYTYFAPAGSPGVLEFWKTVVLPVVTAFLGLSAGKKLS